MGYQAHASLGGTRGLVRGCLLAACIITLAACSGSSKQKESVSDGMVLSGSVGDGPIVSADIRVFDVEGELVLEGMSDAGAGYTLEIPDGIPLPLTVTASGGTDLVTGRPADFELRALALGSGPINVNISPYTTLASLGAMCRPSANAENLPEALTDIWAGIDTALNFGWDRDLQNDPLRDALDESNVAMALLSNEALGELIRRTASALSNNGAPVSADGVMHAVACDLADGRFDGAGPGVDPLISITAMGVSISVQLEVLAGSLQVDEQNAMPLLDAALQTVMSGSDESVSNVASVDVQIDQLRTTLRVLDEVLADPSLQATLLAFIDATPATVRSRAQMLLDGPDRDSLNRLADNLAAASPDVVVAVVETSAQVQAAPTPSLSFSADSMMLQPGESTRLSWAAVNATRCVASGDWSGDRLLEGVFQTASLQAPGEYRLTCLGRGGEATRRVVVVVYGVPDPFSPQDPPAAPDPESVTSPRTPPPAATPAPSIKLSVSSSSLTAGQSTTLSWSATNATICSATGGWSGTRATSGSLSVSPASTTSYTLNCSGAGGSASETVALSVTPASAPRLTFTSADTTVAAGGTTLLSWSSSNTSSCTASGGWSGSRGTAGSQMVGPLAASATFTLSCNGPGGNVLRMLTVSKLGQISLWWQAPTQNVDGTALTDLAGYRIYYGVNSRNYTDSIQILNPTATSQVLSLNSGSYYLAMTALDSEGNESAYSNEVIKATQ